MKTIKKALSLIVCMALIACMAITGMPMVSAEDTETATTTYPVEFANLNAWEWPIVHPGLNSDHHCTHLDRWLNFTPANTESPNPDTTRYSYVTVSRAAYNGTSVDFSGADVFTFVLTVEDNGAWESYKDYLYIRLNTANGWIDIPAADVAEALDVVVPGSTQKIKVNLNNLDKTLLTAVSEVRIGVAEGASTCELDLHITIITMLAEVLPASVKFADLAWDWPVVNPGLTGTISGDANTDAATLNRYLNFTNDISTDVKSYVNVVRSSAGWATVDLSLCDYFALNFWVEDNGAWDVYKDYITFQLDGTSISADATAKALADVVPGTESRIYIDLSSIDKSALTAANIFTISVGGTDQTSDLNLHIKANKLYGEIAYDDVMIGDDEADESIHFLALDTTQAKVGAKSYKRTSFSGGNLSYCGFWGGSNYAAKDASKVTNGGLSGAVRFWVYVDSAATLETVNNLTSSYLYLGSSTHPDGANTGDWWYIWGGWAKQVTEIGWNEVILRMDKKSVVGSANVDLTNIDSMWFKCSADGLTIWVDDFKFSYDTAPTPAYDDVMIIDDEANEGSNGMNIVENAAKVGSHSYKASSAEGGNLSIMGFWGRGHIAAKDISKVTNNGKAGALRFWVYVNNTAKLETFKGLTASYVQIGDATHVDGVNTEDYPGAWITWTGWAKQVTKVGWNEIILPFANAGKGAVDYTNIISLYIRIPNVDGVAMYIDDFKVSESIAPTVESFEDVVILDEENGEDGPYFHRSDTRVRVGSYSLGGTTLADHGWITYKGFYGEEILGPKDISAATNNGKMGALRFWLYVEDISSFDVVKELFNNGAYSYLKLGTAQGPDGCYFGWLGWANQVTKSGWNEIILPFADCYYETGTAPDTTVIDTLYIKLPTGTPSIQLYLDDIRISENIAPTPVEGDANGDGVLNIVDLITVKKSLANGEETYTADDLALVRKCLVNKW